MNMSLSVVRLVLVLAVGDLAIDMSNSSLLVEAKPQRTAVIATEKISTPKTHHPERSTSSDSDEKKGGTGSKDDESLGLTDEDEDSTEKKQDVKHVPKSTEERHGWKKWHRKCQACVEDQKKKWRSPEVEWICGAYQTARRSFKSPCIMHLRNCQDGTMFVKIHDHRCKDDPEHGTHFFYDYSVRLTDESKKSSDSESEEPSSDDSDGRRRGNRRAGSIAKSLALNDTAFDTTAAKITASNDTLIIGTAATSGHQSNSTTTLKQQLQTVRSNIN
ncbi:uncharacterized protein LOC113238961 isoform X3 [Hyposmocoma kahamanoa]|uniref:uncharacterized protein LOC113238961 isoform X3 n=1 Tax=Hyposmocoma kahamanoa TaxID=1477025 RepID=UPI000E6D8A13|nr:uncharacterized protein LOC113238961 isoform X3 [Hyposmocoma kahamanoa]